MRPEIERMSGVRAVVDIPAYLRADPNHETAQRPVARADGECPRTRLVEIGQSTDDSFNIEVRGGGHRHSPEVREHRRATTHGVSGNTIRRAPPNSATRCRRRTPDPR